MVVRQLCEQRGGRRCPPPRKTSTSSATRTGSAVRSMNVLLHTTGRCRRRLLSASAGSSGQKTFQRYVAVCRDRVTPLSGVSAQHCLSQTRREYRSAGKQARPASQTKTRSGWFPETAPSLYSFECDAASSYCCFKCRRVLRVERRRRRGCLGSALARDQHTVGGIRVPAACDGYEQGVQEHRVWSQVIVREHKPVAEDSSCRGMASNGFESEFSSTWHFRPCRVANDRELRGATVGARVTAPVERLRLQLERRWLVLETFRPWRRTRHPPAAVPAPWFRVEQRTAVERVAARRSVSPIPENVDCVGMLPVFVPLDRQVLLARHVVRAAWSCCVLVAGSRRC
jgi:hypothetical protein